MGKLGNFTEEQLRAMLDEHAKWTEDVDRQAGYNDDAERSQVTPQFNIEAIGDIVGPHRYGIPFLLDRRNIQALFQLSARAAQRLIKRHLVPMGAVVKVGSKYMIQPWGVYKLLNPNLRCAYCGLGGKGDCPTLPKLSTAPLPTERSDTKRLERHKGGKKAPIEEL